MAYMPYVFRKGASGPMAPAAAPAPPPAPPASTTSTPPWVGGTPAGSAAPVGNFGINTLPSPAAGSWGALGLSRYQQPNPWANHLLASMGAANPWDPSANLFRTMPPGSVYPGASPATPPGAVPNPSPPPIGPSGPSMGAPSVTTAPGATGGPLSSMPITPPPSGPPRVMPGGMRIPGAGGGTPSDGGGASPWMMTPNIMGNTPMPSPLLAASNPASGLPQAMSVATTPGSPNLSLAPPPGAYGGPPLVSPPRPVGNPPPIRPRGIMTTQYADGGGVSDPDIPGSAGGTPSARIANIVHSLASPVAAPPAASSSATPGGVDPIIYALMRANNPVSGGMGGGGNDVDSLLMRLGVHPGPNVVRAGSRFAAGGPLSHAGPGHVSGESSGQADDVNARLSDGEYVIDADVVSALGDGNNAAGARSLDQLREAVRKDKRSAPANKIPPKAKPAVKYLPRKKKTAASAAADVAKR
jgi:hypothetical protein